MSQRIPTGTPRYAFAAATVLVAVLLRMLLQPFFEPGSFRLLILALAASTWFGGLGPGLLAVVLGAAASGEFFHVPGAGPPLPDGDDALRLAMFLLEGAVVVGVIASLRRARGRARIAERRREEDFRRHQERERVSRAELEASEQRYRMLSEALPQIVWSTDGQGRLQYCNRRWYEFTGLGVAETLGDWSGVIHDEDQERVRSAWDRALVTGVDFVCEFRLLRAADREWRWHLGRAVPVRDVRGTIVRWLGTASDVDDLKRAQQLMLTHASVLEHKVAARTEELERQKRELETRNDQMASFAYTVSHDLRSPLRAMRGYSDALLDDFGDALGPRGRDYLQRIGDASVRMNTLIEGLLAYGRLGRIELPSEPVGLRAALDEALAAIQEEFVERRVRLAVTIAGDLPEVLGHHDTLVQVLQNLLLNAAKFVRPGETPDITVGATRHDQRVRVWVEDHGIGIEPRFFERIFGIFERLHTGSAYPGTGIGLAIVHSAVQRMGGEVGVESTPGVGSRFWVELPEVPAPSARPALVRARPLESIR